MTDIVLALKARARILHRDIQKRDRPALTRARQHRDLSTLEDHEIPEKVKRRHCFSIIAIELGFKGWPHLLEVLKQNNPSDYGTFFYPKRCRVHWNIWFATYDEAAKVRKDHGGFLIAYKNQFMVVDEDYIRSFGLDPEDREIEKIGRDWIKLPDQSAKQKLYGKIIEEVLQ